MGVVIFVMFKNHSLFCCVNKTERELFIMFKPKIEEIENLSKEYKYVPVSTEIFSDTTTPIQVLKILKKCDEHCFLLESVEKSEKVGRYSFLGFEPSMEITCSNGVLKIKTKDKTEIIKTVSPQEYIKQILENHKTPKFDFMLEKDLLSDEKEPAEHNMLVDLGRNDAGRIAKFGNRALTSKAGAIDVLEALGINVNKTPEEEKEIFNKLNICFMFAQNHHPSFKYAAEARKKLKIRTLFNILGPLTNPACANSQLFGVYDEKLTIPLCKVISNLGVNNVLVVHGKDGIDEAALTSETIIAEHKNGIFSNYTIKPEDFNLKRCSKKDIEGGTPQENAQIIRDIFERRETGAKKDIVVLNSALAFYTYGKTFSIKEGIDLANSVIDSCKALAKLDDYIKITNEV